MQNKYDIGDIVWAEVATWSYHDGLSSPKPNMKNVVYVGPVVIIDNGVASGSSNYTINIPVNPTNKPGGAEGWAITEEQIKCRIEE